MDVNTGQPQSIIIQGIPYKVFWVASEDAILDVVDEEASEVVGETVTGKLATLGFIDHDRESISIVDTFPVYSKKVTLLHEVLHGCLNVIDKDDDEALVHGLAYTLLDTLRRNPELVHYLMEGAV